MVKKKGDQYKEWDGIWFGRYAQWFFLIFFYFGFGAVMMLIVLAFVK